MRARLEEWRLEGERFCEGLVVAAVERSFVIPFWCVCREIVEIVGGAVSTAPVATCSVSCHVNVQCTILYRHTCILEYV